MGQLNKRLAYQTYGLQTERESAHLLYRSATR